MAPSVADLYPSHITELKTRAASVVAQSMAELRRKVLVKEPLKLSGVLDQFKSVDLTPAIGREYPDAKLIDWLNAPNADELIRDLAIIVSQRGVVFFRAQDGLSNDDQKVLCNKLGQLTGKPESSSLHIHPISNTSFQGNDDDEISVISNDLATKIFCDRTVKLHERKQSLKKGWHSDITFEPVPSDYAILRLSSLPQSGGDTLWASGYDVYDRFSPPYQQFLDSLTATYAQPLFTQAARERKLVLYPHMRGSPDNIGTELSTVHPVVRTNPITGWKSVFAVGHHVQRINGLTERESNHLLEEFLRIITENHDLQVRFKWMNTNDLAIWDNRSTYHAATYDYDGMGLRRGERSVGIGEKPYFDPNSTSRLEALGKEVMEPGEGFTVF